jgi:hypothetical protein
MIPVVLYQTMRRGSHPRQRGAWRSTKTIEMIILVAGVASMWITLYISLLSGDAFSASTSSWKLPAQERRTLQVDSVVRNLRPGPLSALPLGTALPPLRWKNDYDLVHVVHTRFMQHQSHLIHLGRARMELFRTITLPSMKEQSSSDFLWIIHIDPNLPDELKEGFLDIQSNMEDLVVVLSNENLEGFRVHGMDDVPTNAHVLGRTDGERTRRRNLLQSYFAAAQSRLVLESRLDADDALTLEFARMIQDEARGKMSTENESDYRVWCMGNHLEWQFYNPWNADAINGSLVAFPFNHCVTPGITFAYNINATADNVPTHKHHKLHMTIPLCRKKSKGKCLTVWHPDDNKPLALRARTPTSAGMSNVLLSHNTDPSLLRELEQWSQLQRRAWREVTRIFGIEISSVVRMHKAIDADLALVAADNAMGQCTPGHSCKSSSKTALSALSKH